MLLLLRLKNEKADNTQPYAVRLRQEIESIFDPAALESLRTACGHIAEAILVPTGVLAFCKAQTGAAPVMMRATNFAGRWKVEPVPAEIARTGATAPQFHLRTDSQLALLHQTAFDEICAMPNACMHMPSAAGRPSLLDVVLQTEDVLRLLKASTNLKYIDIVRHWPRTVLHIVSKVRSTVVFDFLLDAGADPCLVVDDSPCAREAAFRDENLIAVAAYVGAARGEEQLNWWETEGMFHANLAVEGFEELVAVALARVRAGQLVTDILAEINLPSAGVSHGPRAG